jgi:hypothetical protein
VLAFDMLAFSIVAVVILVAFIHILFLIVDIAAVLDNDIDAVIVLADIVVILMISWLY